MRLICIALIGLILPCLAHPIEYHNDPFRQLEEVLPTPTESRIASGAPGPQYWQQRADYDIKISLDEKKNHLTGTETITYHNKSPHTLSYLWMQLDRNKYTPGSMGHQTSTSYGVSDMSFKSFESLLLKETFQGGFNITRLVDIHGNKIEHRVVDTMMKVKLPKNLLPNQKFTFTLDWDYTISNSRTTWGRSNMEVFKKKGKIYEIAQWYPRVCAYTDVRGWQNKAFLGRGEFALEFGDYKVAITVPDNHVVASTGELKNGKDCLKPAWQNRLKTAETVTDPMFIVTPEEAAENEKTKATGTKTWIFEAKNVRDFAWASSKKFIWDAVQHKLVTNQKPVWAMSYYPNEAEPLWSQYSTHSIIHTLNFYSKYTFDYPYPVAISVNGPVFGMEYPMLCFNGPRPEKDGTYSERTKNSLISVIIHEVGHNWFPMIVNSDERQWTWMDEGLNSFLQLLAEQEWRENYPSRGTPRGIINYMTSPRQRPIMTNSESILQFSANAYSKPATGLNILRETILGREVFDEAFKEFSQRWMFKSPEPADFFRTMEDASGVDLDWFWHTWFYTTNHVDIEITSFTRYKIDRDTPDEKAEKAREEDLESDLKNITGQRNKDIPKYVEQNESLKDFYDSYDKHEVSKSARDKYRKMIDSLTKKERRLLASKKNLTVAEFQNNGGVIMPILVELHFEKGNPKLVNVPAEIWKQNHKNVRKLFITNRPVTKIVIDPQEQTADSNLKNNTWPPQLLDETFSLSKSEEPKSNNPMKRAQDAKAKEEKAAKKKAKAKAKAKKKGNAKDDTKAKAAKDAKADTKMKAKAKTKPKAKTKDKIKVDAKAKTEAKVDTKAKAAPKAEPKPKATAAPKAKPEAKKSKVTPKPAPKNKPAKKAVPSK